MEEIKIISESIIAQEKAEAIIDSCINCEHLKHAKEYVRLYLAKFKDNVDPISFNKLMQKFSYKKTNFNCNG